jgi:hypothetical protein
MKTSVYFHFIGGWMGDYQLYIGEKKNWSGKEMPDVVHVLLSTID